MPFSFGGGVSQELFYILNNHFGTTLSTTRFTFCPRTDVINPQIHVLISYRYFQIHEWDRQCSTTVGLTPICLKI